jgi:hypothetical protein
MDATPQLRRIADALREVGLEAVLIGNAAAALRGAPVTTLDFDFLFRKSRGNVSKLKRLADALGATVLRPYYPASDLYRVVCDETGLQLDFMGSAHGIRSFEGLRRRALAVRFGDSPILVAHLDDIIRSKRAAGRARDLAVIEILERTKRLGDATEAD